MRRVSCFLITNIAILIVLGTVLRLFGRGLALVRVSKWVHYVFPIILSQCGFLRGLDF